MSSKLIICFAVIVLSAGALTQDQDKAESKAIAFLVREVPAWSTNNGCFSCHNNGDAARALYVATKKGYKPGVSALSDTTDWLARPTGWDSNKGDPGFSDKRLANIQFGAALVAAFDTGRLPLTMTSIEEAAKKIAADQEANGSWSIDLSNTTGSPATYGTPLATVMALKTLNRATSHTARTAARSAEVWLRRLTPINIPVAAAITFVAPDRAATEFILKAQTRDGGWGPYADSVPEAFDTALALLSLAASPREPRTQSAIRRGRAFLASIQNDDGSWPATTRPTGGESYAQMISTTGWATLALLETRGR